MKSIMMYLLLHQKKIKSIPIIEAKVEVLEEEEILPIVSRSAQHLNSNNDIQKRGRKSFASMDAAHNTSWSSVPPCAVPVGRHLCRQPIPHWIGLEINLKEYSLGVSASRAAWAWAG